jgi:hypothetical protein
MTTDINTEILKESEYTVKTAKKELGKTLDYSVTSLKDLDLLIEHVKNHFLNLKSEGKLSDQTIQKASVSIGCYLGEVIRRAYEGTWTAKNAILKTLVLSGKEVSPIRYIFDRLNRDSDYSLDKYWSDIEQMIYPQEKDTTVQGIKNSFNENKKLFIGAAVIFVCVSLSMLAGALYLNIRATNKFKSQLDSFLAEAEKISVMTEQGVTYQNFSSQYYEVKTAYNLIDYWPPSYQDEKRSFDLALEGWKLTLDVWQFGYKDPKVKFDLPVGNYYETALINYWSLYVGVNLTTGRKMTTNDWIGAMMNQAYIYYEAGKAGIK